MIQEEAEKLLPIMAAFAKGEEVQFRSSPYEAWCPLKSLSFNKGADCYRIKPKLRECWLATPTTLGLLHNPYAKEEFCNAPTWNANYWTFTLMREVEKP